MAGVSYGPNFLLKYLILGFRNSMDHNLNWGAPRKAPTPLQGYIGTESSAMFYLNPLKVFHSSSCISNDWRPVSVGLEPEDDWDLFDECDEVEGIRLGTSVRSATSADAAACLNREPTEDQPIITTSSEDVGLIDLAAQRSGDAVRKFCQFELN